MIRIKRIYEPASADDGRRVLVDRLWPRGISRDEAALDEWNKDVAPSAELRRWFAHDPAKFAEFHRRYLEELADNAAAKELRQTKGQLTLLYSAKDTEHNQALVLKDFLDKTT